MGIIKKTGGAVLVLIASLAPSEAQLLIDDFSVEGGLSGTTPEVGGIWTTTTGTAGQIKVIDGEATVPVTGWEVVTSSFPLQSNNTTYSGFTFNYWSPTGYPVEPGPTMVGHAGLMLGDSYYFDGNGDFVLMLDDGMSNNFSGGPSGLTYRWPVSLTANTDYRIVLGFTENGDQDQLTLWVNPVGIGSPSVSGKVGAISSGVSGFQLYENGYQGVYFVDNLYVGSSFSTAAGITPLPEPSVGLLIFSAFVSLPRLRRIRRK
jgi:hypothetical protein